MNRSAVEIGSSNGSRLVASFMRLWNGELGPLPVLLGLVLIGAVFQSLNPNFLTPRNLSNLVLQIAVVGTLGAVVVSLSWFTERTVTGRHIYAIGGNAEAARRAGISVSAIRIGVFSIIGVLAGLGGVLSASRQFAVSIGTGGGTLLLDAIAAAVTGGTSLFGGRGRIYHAILGALVIGSVANGLDLLGAPSSTKNIATGIILVAAVAIDALSRSRR
jgi:ABC-type xylose transport system permease subunit